VGAQDAQAKARKLEAHQRACLVVAVTLKRIGLA
jgi:hypothetical protein